MLITFQSKATPDVLMLRDLAGYLLGLVGKRIDARGVITHEELPGAIRRLEAALIEDENFAQEHGGTRHGAPVGHISNPAGLVQRAYPFLDMMRESQKQDADIIWGL